MSSTALVVIPCLNEERSLPALLTRLVTQNPGMRIVVADGGSTDASRAIVTAAAAHHPQIALVANPDRIQSAGINRAVAAYGDGVDWLVRVDAHCVYPDDFVERLLYTANAQAATSVVVPMVSVGEGCFQAAAATAQNSRLGTGGSAHRHVGAGGWVDHGHHALMQIDLFRRVGGYRRDMSHNEDAELDHRLACSGGRIWLEPTLALGYYPRRTPRALWRQYWSYGRGRARTVELHRLRLRPRQMLPLAVPVAAVVACLAPVWPLAALPLAAWGLACLGAGAVIGARAGGGCRLGAGVAAGIMHLAWGAGFIFQSLHRAKN